MGFGVDDGGFDQSPPPAVLLVGIRADRYGYRKCGSDVLSLLDNTMKPTGTACWVLSGRCSRLGVVLLVRPVNSTAGWLAGSAGQLDGRFSQ